MYKEIQIILKSAIPMKIELDDDIVELDKAIYSFIWEEKLINLTLIDFLKTKSCFGSLSID